MDSFQTIDPALIDAPIPVSLLTDGQSGYPEHLAAEDTPDALWDCCGSASTKFPEKLWLERKDWADKARQNDKDKTWPMNYLDRYTAQNPTHECTTHSAQANATVCRNRQRGIIFPDGPKKGFRYEESAIASVFLSPLSVYIEANPQKWGGANVLSVLKIAVRRGFLPDKIQPRDYGFKHQLQGTTGDGNSNQSSGPWVRLADLPEDWQETAKWFRPQEVIFPESFEQAVCLVLHGYAVSVGRDGHAVPWMQWLPDQQVMAYPDSYNVTRYDSLRTVQRAWRGSFAIASMTAPDDWDKPAG